MNWTKISTQAELDVALAKDGGWLDLQAGFRLSVTKGNWRIRVAADFRASVVARGNSSVVAWGNSSVEAWGNSSIEARGNSSVVAWENSSVVARGNSSVVAWENSSVVARENSSVVARGNVFVRLFSALKIKASAHVVIMRHGKSRSPEGGRVLEANRPSTPTDWCDHYGVAVENGIATLYKAVDEDFSTDRARSVGISYAPGQAPVAPDWDGGERECGGGLHASPHPKMALEFNAGKHFIACPVRLEDIAVHPDGNYPQKVKFKGCAAPCYEVDRDGKPISEDKSEGT